MYALRVGLPDVDSEPFIPQGETLGFEFPPSVGPCAESGVCGETISQPLLPTSVEFSSSLSSLQSPLSKPLGFPREDIVLYVAVNSVRLWERASSGSFCVTVLTWNLYSPVFLMIQHLTGRR